MRGRPARRELGDRRGAAQQPNTVCPASMNPAVMARPSPRLTPVTTIRCDGCAGISPPAVDSCASSTLPPRGQDSYPQVARRESDTIGVRRERITNGKRGAEGDDGEWVGLRQS